MKLTFDSNNSEAIMRLLVEKEGFNLDCFDSDTTMNISNNLDDIATVVNTLTKHGFKFTLSTS